MTLWTAEEAAAATGGAGPGGWTAGGVSIDTRTLRPGDLFVALTAERDGHAFVADALGKGAAAALVSRRPEGVAADAPLLTVPDVQGALVAMGRAARARGRARVVAVTGSVGKTSTKEMLRAMLAPQGRTHAAEASYNNHWGVPLTLARMPADADFAVIEIGMNHPGEIAPLARQARPHVALVTTVGPAHLEAFGSVAGIAREKASICEGLEPGGAAVLNGDLAETPILIAAAQRAGARVVTFGVRGGHASPGRGQHPYDLGLWKWVDGAHVEMEAICAAAGRSVTLRVPGGRHMVVNALGALAAAVELGADLDAAIAGLRAWRPAAGRGSREPVPWAGGTLTLVDDAFNANPLSMEVALGALAWSAGPNGRAVAILGDMLELGPDERDHHARLADLPLTGIDAIHCVGPRMRALHEVVPLERRGLWAASPEDLVPALPRLLAPGDVVLVKGSKGSRVARVVDAIRGIGQGAAPPSARDAGGT